MLGTLYHNHTQSAICCLLFHIFIFTILFISSASSGFGCDYLNYFINKITLNDQTNARQPLWASVCLCALVFVPFLHAVQVPIATGINSFTSVSSLSCFLLIRVPAEPLPTSFRLLLSNQILRQISEEISLPEMIYPIQHWRRHSSSMAAHRVLIR